MRTVQLDVKYTERQSMAHNALDEASVRRLLYGGAKGGGKSYFLCIWCFLYIWDLCVKFNLIPTDNPIHAGWMGRKQSTDFAATTLQTWRQIIPQEYYSLKSGTEKDSKHILIMDRVAIDYGGLDRQESINKFNSAEYGFIAIDQAEETERDNIAVLRGSLRLKINGQELPYKEIYTANPRVCWLRDDFIIEQKPNSVFVPALPSDNPHLPSDYEATLMDAFGYRPELLAAYLHGDWSQIEDESQVIRDAWLVMAKKAVSKYSGKIICCDVARFGDDKTEIMVLEGTEIEYEETLGHCRTTEISSRLNDLSRENGDCPVIVDSIGVGAGVVDELYQWGRMVIGFNSSEKPLEEDGKEKFFNLRAQAWWKAAEDFAHTNIGCKRMSTELRKQLCVSRYEFRNGKILIESKEKIKERLGYSPDKADCYIMGLFGIRDLKLESIYSGANSNQRSYNYDPLAGQTL